MDIDSVRQVVSLFVSAPIFHSDGEVETMTGFSLDEYRQLSRDLDDIHSVPELSSRQMAMIEQGAETLRSIPNRGREIYEDPLGPDYEGVLGQVAEAMSARLPPRR